MNTRKIKFRYWDKKNKKFTGGDNLFAIDRMSNSAEKQGFILQQYTGLKDKNGLTDIYEDDIIDIEANLIGNKYENSNLLKEKTNLLIEGFGTKNWCSTYKKTMDRGCKNSE